NLGCDSIRSSVSWRRSKSQSVSFRLHSPLMTIDDIRSLYAYNAWANQRIFESIGQLTPPQLAQPLGGSFSSIRDTVAHIVFAEWLWLRRWKGESPSAQPDWVKGDITSLREKLMAIE